MFCTAITIEMKNYLQLLAEVESGEDKPRAGKCASPLTKRKYTKTTMANGNGNVGNAGH